MQLVLTPASRRLISLSTLTSPYLDNGLLQSIEYPLRMLYKLNPLPLQFGSPFPFARSDRAVFRAIVTNFFPSQLPVRSEERRVGTAISYQYSVYYLQHY